MPHSMWARFAVVVGLAFAGVILIEVVVQLVYPADRLPPVLRLGNSVHWFAREQLITSRLSELDNETVKIIAGETSYTMTYRELGFSHDVSGSMRALTDYPLTQRLIPFSIVARGWTPVTFSHSTDTKVLSAFAERLAGERAVAAVDAKIENAGGVLKLVPSQTGVRYDPETVSRAITAAMEHGSTKIKLNPESSPPQLTNESVTALLPDMQRQVDAGLTLRLDAVKVTANKQTMAGWVRLLPADDSSGRAVLVFDPGAIRTFISSFKGAFSVAAGSSTVTMVDGLEVGRTPASAGRTIDIGAATGAVTSALTTHATEVQLSAVPVPPGITYARSYSASQAGLQALVGYLASTKRAYGIALQEIGGRGWQASANAGRVFTTASTYKLFVAYSVLLRIESGQFSWADSVNGTDRATCFDRMIINSDNPCAVETGKQVGWNNVEAEVHALGLSSATRLGTSFASTAGDEAIFMEKLARGQILNADSRARLIDRMKRQRFRAGIPAGTGADVADKVGFLSGLLHDAAIVYAPGHTYVLVILTDGSSWGQIADTARQIQTQMAR